MLIQEEKVEIVEEKKSEPKQSSNKITSKKANMQIIGYIVAFIFILIAILAIIFGGFTIYNLKHSKVIAKGVHIYGIDVSRLSKEAAKEKVSAKFNEISKKDIELSAENYKTYLNPSEIGLTYHIDSAINYAMNYGKNGNLISDNYTILETMIKGINITPTHSLNESDLKKYLDNISKDLPNAVVESSYFIEDNKLIIQNGKDGYIVDTEKTSNDIISSINDFSFLSKPVTLSLTKVSANKIDLDKIYKEVYKAPVDAHYTKNPYTIYPSKTGIDFAISLAEAKKKVEQSTGEVEIKLKTTYPKVTTNMIGTEAFPDLIGSFSTNYYTGNTNRVTNLKLAAKKINGVVLLPGETFSYNGIVGQRTIAAGYKEASVYMNGKEVMGLGGGICQVSTTLFNAALFANLGMVEVYNHQFVPQYSQTGRDATVSWGTKDFKFKNTRNYAIKISCTVSGGVAKVNIYGIKEPNEPKVNISVKINSKTASYTKSTTYRTLTQNGKTLSTEKIYTCTYKPH